VAEDDYGRVPAGWYPDPLGLPQLRWWDNNAWTEHVSDARQPMVPADGAPPAPTIFADDEELPRRRRDLRSASTPEEAPLDQPTANVLKQLAPPTTNTVPQHVEPQNDQPGPARSAPPAPGQPANSAAEAFAAAAFADLSPQSALKPPQSAEQVGSPWVPLRRDGGSAQGSAPGSTPGSTPSQQGSAPQYGSAPPYGSAPQYGSAPRYGSAPQYGNSPGYGSAPGSAPGFASAPGAPQYSPYSPYSPYSQESPLSATEMRRSGTHQTLGAPSSNVQTVEAWAIALIPMMQLLLSLLVVAAFTTGPSIAFMAAIWVLPYPIVALLAYFDARGLKRRGVDAPASWLWALGTAPVYLAARAVQLSRISSAGFGPVAVWLLLTGLVGASVLAVPGLVVAALPGVFADQASETIEANARSIGTPLDVNCPASPPLFIGQQLRCPATNTNSEEDLVVTVSLQRANGWIAWQVDDWGVFTFVR